MTVSELNIKITGDSAQITTALQKAIDKLQGTGEASEKAMKQVEKSSESAKRSIMALHDGLEILKMGLGAFKDFASEAMRAQEADAKLEQVLRSTKGAAGMTMESLDDLTKSMVAQTTADHEVVKETEHMLLTFTNVGKDVFPMATETVLNMSAALGQDTKASAIQLGKALNDPIGGVTALRRVGVMLNDQQQENIRTLMEQGKLQEAQGVILGELQTEFGGVAKAMADTPAGKYKQAMVSLGEIKVVLGGMFLEVIQPIMTGIKKLADVLVALLESEGVKTLLKVIVDTLANVLEPVIKMIVPLVQQLAPLIGELLKAAGELVGSVLKAAAPLLQVIVDIVKALMPTITMLIRIIAQIFDAARPLIELLAQTVQKFLPVLTPLLESVVKLVAALLPILNLILPLVTWILEKSIKFVSDVITPVVDAITFIIENATKAIEAIGSIFGASKKAEQAYDRPHGVSSSWGDEETSAPTGAPAPTTVTPTVTRTGGTKKTEQKETIEQYMARMVKMREEAAKLAEFLKRIAETPQVAVDAMGQIDPAFAEIHDQLEANWQVTDMWANSLQNIGAILADLAKVFSDSFEMSKAISIAQAIVNTYEAATKALAQGGAIFGPILMATTIAAGFAQVARIIETKPEKKRYHGGPVEGRGVYMANEEGGEEFVMNSPATAQNRGLLRMLNSGLTLADVMGGITMGAFRRPGATSTVHLEGDFGFKDGAIILQLRKDVEIEHGQVM